MISLFGFYGLDLIFRRISPGDQFPITLGTILHDAVPLELHLARIDRFHDGPESHRAAVFDIEGNGVVTFFSSFRICGAEVRDPKVPIERSLISESVRNSTAIPAALRCRLYCIFIGFFAFDRYIFSPRSGSSAFIFVHGHFFPPPLIREPAVVISRRGYLERYRVA